MNWYFEEHGVSKGPFPEDEFARMVLQREVPNDSLVWKPGLEEWATLATLRPPWFKGPLSGSAEKDAKTSAPRKPTSSKMAAADDELPVIEPAIPTESSVTPGRAPAQQSKLKPQAPSPGADKASESPEKSGLLKRVFGFGGSRRK